MSSFATGNRRLEFANAGTLSLCEGSDAVGRVLEQLTFAARAFVERGQQSSTVMHERFARLDVAVSLGVLAECHRATTTDIGNDHGRGCQRCLVYRLALGLQALGRGAYIQDRHDLHFQR